MFGLQVDHTTYQLPLSLCRAKSTFFLDIKCQTQTEELWDLEMETYLAWHSQDNSAIKTNMASQIERVRWTEPVEVATLALSTPPLTFSKPFFSLKLSFTLKFDFEQTVTSLKEKTSV